MERRHSIFDTDTAYHSLTERPKQQQCPCDQISSSTQHPQLYDAQPIASQPAPTPLTHSPKTPPCPTPERQPKTPTLSKSLRSPNKPQLLPVQLNGQVGQQTRASRHTSRTERPARCHTSRITMLLPITEPRMDTFTREIGEHVTDSLQGILTDSHARHGRERRHSRDSSRCAFRRPH